MRSRILRRRAATAFGVYGSAVLGFAATVFAARELSNGDFGRFALVFSTTALLQVFVDLTIDEVVIKYGNRYIAREQWGRFRRLVRVGLAVKVAGGALGAACLVGAAFLSPWLWRTGGVRGALLIASLVPLIQQPEGMAGAVLTLRNRYDLRGLFLLWAMGLRLLAVALAAPHGLLTLFGAIVAAQAVSTLSVGAVGFAAFRRYRRAPEEELGEDRAPIRTFAIHSTVASGLLSLRSSLPTVLVGVVAKTNAVAGFRAAQAPQTAFQTLSAPARLVLLAEQTRDVEHGRTERAFALLRRYIGSTTLLACVVTPPAWVFMRPLVRLVYGAKYEPAVNAFRVMLLAAALQLVFGWTRTFPVSIGRVGMRTVGQVVEVATLVPAVLVLGALWGATGAAGGVLAGSVALALFWTVGLVRLPHPVAA
ncbi:MAG: lipopolysaccharide biosynthesis protein [Actinobacteria bacterium]|nr:lipopolysaccharide biosynthesis protein [Actinomycetota bacterium]